MFSRLIVCGAAVVAAMLSTTVWAQTTIGSPTPPTRLARDAQSPPRGPTAEQIANIEKRLSITRSIVDRLTPEASALGLAEGWKSAMTSQLLQLPLAKLAAVAGAGGYQATHDAALKAAQDAGDSPKALGDAMTDLVYRPITPCRLFDTRNVGGRINGLRQFDFNAAGGAYGGDVSCRPFDLFGSGLVALSLNVTIVDPVGAPGFVRATPAGSTSSTSLVNWYQAGAAVQAANSGIITIDPTPGGDPNELDIFSSSAVHVIADVFGGFVSASSLRALDCLESNNTQPLAGSVGATATVPYLVCAAGYTMTGGYCNTDTDDTAVRITSTGPTSCRFTNEGTNPSNARARAVCCRMPF